MCTYAQVHTHTHTSKGFYTVLQEYCTYEFCVLAASGVGILYGSNNPVLMGTPAVGDAARRMDNRTPVSQTKKVKIEFTWYISNWSLTFDQ